MRITASTVTEAVVDIMKAANPGGIIDQALAAKIGGEIRPTLEKVLTGKVGSGAELVGMSEFRNILNQHLGSSKSSYVESETRKLLQRTLETANRTGSEFSALATQNGPRMMLRVPGESSRDGGEGRRGERVSAAMTRDAPLSVSGGIGFAKELGISPGYAGFFAGGSPEMRDALRNAITSGKAITDDQVKNMKDVGMVLGAIRAGKLKPDDPRIPGSVKKIVVDMNAKGIDPTKADNGTIQKYLKDNPKALEAAKKEISRDKTTASHLSDQQLAEAVKAQAGKAVATAKKGTTPSKIVSKTL